MYPSLVAEDLRSTLTEFLGATFALSDDDVRTELQRFLLDREHGIFRGPFVRLRLPFRPADETWRDHLAWAPDGFTPYRHQARAFARLDSRQGRPRPTLVTTGTGSGKTESFLFPVLDHARRRRAAGGRGITAVLLYPMNALANDQARRLAELIDAEPALHGITAGLYTGDKDGSGTMTATEVITDRYALRDDPPDILLTNYKMLDYLLLRADDGPLWAGADQSLQYLVLDEFHTYDGAQGTDVAMLLRRFGARLGLADGERPLGRVVPVATSATLGGDDGLDRILGFAEEIFGETFDPEAVIGEDRLSPHEWTQHWTARGRTAAPTPPTDLPRPVLPRAALATAARGELLTRARYPRHEQLLDLTHALFFGDGTAALAERLPPRPDPVTLGRELAQHPLTGRLLEAASTPQTLDDLLTVALPRWNLADPQVRETARAVLSGYLGLVSEARSRSTPTAPERPFLQVEVQQWIREVRRLLRRVGPSAELRWESDHLVEGPSVELPAVYCRHCGRSGWAALRPPAGSTLDITPKRIWGDTVQDPGRQVTLIHAPGEAASTPRSDPNPVGPNPVGPDPVGQDPADPHPPLVQWFVPYRREVVTEEPTDEDAVPVLPLLDRDAARDQTCPACGVKDGVRFMGSRVATLVSVVLGHLFGSPDLPDEHKKTLLFTDSVQDAAHRASFVEDRAYALNQRASLAAAVPEYGTSVDGVAPRQLDAALAGPLTERYALIPPDLHEHEGFRPFWRDAHPEPDVINRVRQRLSFGAVSEFGLAARTGRSLEITGTLSTTVTLGQRRALLRELRSAVDDLPARQQTLEEAGDVDPLATARWWAWVWGVLERMRTNGAVEHRWFDRYLDDDGNRWSIWGGRPREEGMPAFPAGRPAPSYPATSAPAGRRDTFSLITGPRGWYARWTSKCLHVPPSDSPAYLRCFFEVLTRRAVLRRVTTGSGAGAWVIPQSSLAVTPVRLDQLTSGAAMLRCRVCADRRPGVGDLHEALDGGPCLRDRCPGEYETERVTPDYYRELYRAGRVRRIVAREHTGLLDGAVRAGLEASFKEPRTPDAPNVLACTPTLELGIDIGDLSVVTLTSLPRSTAAYLQRVGRAGRRTGNALVVAVLPGRPLELRRLADPLGLIAGDVVPPACYLDATEILHRQFFAHLVDRTARRGESPPSRMGPLMRGGVGAGSWLGALLDDVRESGAERVTTFLDLFGPGLGAPAREELRAWAVRQGQEPSPLERTVAQAAGRWQAEQEAQVRRIRDLESEVDRLDALGDHVDDDTERDRRQVRGELARARAARRERTAAYWIAGLEALGLLPNYALLDDRTTLDVALWWRDEDSGRAETTESHYTRGSRVALRELAPGAVFYVRGSALHVDAVSLGPRGQAAFEQRRLCPTCSWSGPDEGPVPCPRCGDARAADTGQVLPAVLFRGASAYESRDQARSGDLSDDRDRTPFHLRAGVVVAPGSVGSAWRLKDFAFGVEYARQADITWYNLGPEHTGGRTRTLLGEDVPSPLFQVCRSCGVVPSAQRTLGGGRRTATDARHRGWCPQRRQPDPDGWAEIALMHQLRTQVVRMLVPPIVMRDHVLLESFRAALLRGMRETLGGDPDHLDVLIATGGRAADPQPIMVLHDLVPGGTGYLGELAAPERLHDLLEITLKTLESCPCAAEGQTACHRCLLAFVAPSLADEVRRDRAVDLVRGILAAWDVETLDSLDELEVSPHESPLEIRFRQALQTWLRDRGTSVAVQAQTWGDAWTFRLTDPSARHDLRWTMNPQVDVDGVRPDFVFAAPETPLKIALFTDGARYHSTPQHNRLADDATKRALLRDRGYLVWSLTHDDLDVFLGDRANWAPTTTPHVVKPGPLPGATQAQTDEFLQIAIRIAAHATPGSVPPQALTGDPVSVLLRLLQRPDLSAWDTAGRALGLALVDRTGWDGTLDAGSAAEIAADLSRLDDTTTPPQISQGGGRPVARRRSTSGAGLVLTARPGRVPGVDAVVAVDDRGHVVGTPAQLRAWHDWLALANLLQLGSNGTGPECVTVSQVTQGDVPTPTAPAAADEPAPSAPAPRTDAWLTEFLAQVAQEVRPLLQNLTHDAVLAADVGYETDDGVPVEVAWPQHRLAVLAEHDPEVEAWAAAEGWDVVIVTEKGAGEVLARRGLLGVGT